MEGAMSNETAMTLEQRIAAALLDANAVSGELTILMKETEAAIIAADQTAAAERERALDPALTPDPREAHQAMEEAVLAAGRLRTLLPRLERRCQQVATAECLGRWKAEFTELKIERDDLTEELAEVYPAVVSELIDLFSRISVHEAEVSRLHQSRPSGVSLHLAGPEQEARGLESFSRDTPSLIKTIQLFDFSGKQVWPPKRTPLGVLVVQGMQPVHDPRYTAVWAQARGERDDAIKAEQQRVAEYYDNQQRLKERREAAEAQERAQQPRR
jgi:hypothetical protein